MSNLLKRGYTFIVEDSKRVIDSNNLVARKMEELEEETKTETAAEEETGFREGLHADELGVLFEDGGQSTETPPVYEGPSQEEIMEKANIQIEEMEQEARTRLEQERQQVLEQSRQEGYEAGYAEGKTKGLSEADAMKQELQKKQAQLMADYEETVSQLEPDFIDALTGIYEYVFQVELQDHKEILTYLLSKTLGQIDGERNFLIHVSKEDYEYVSERKEQIVSVNVAGSANVEFVEDMSLGSNECLIETDGGIYDCGLDTQLQELTRKLKLLSYEKK